MYINQNAVDDMPLELSDEDYEGLFKNYSIPEKRKKFVLEYCRQKFLIEKQPLNDADIKKKAYKHAGYNAKSSASISVAISEIMNNPIIKEIISNFGKYTTNKKMEKSLNLLVQLQLWLMDGYHISDILNDEGSLKGKLEDLSRFQSFMIQSVKKVSKAGGKVDTVVTMEPKTSILNHLTRLIKMSKKLNADISGETLKADLTPLLSVKMFPHSIEECRNFNLTTEEKSVLIQYAEELKKQGYK